MSYLPPPINEVTLELEPYEVPAINEVDFELNDGTSEKRYIGANIVVTGVQADIYHELDSFLEANNTPNITVTTDTATVTSTAVWPRLNRWPVEHISNTLFAPVPSGSTNLHDRLNSTSGSRYFETNFIDSGSAHVETKLDHYDGFIDTSNPFYLEWNIEDYDSFPSNMSYTYQLRQGTSVLWSNTTSTYGERQVTIPTSVIDSITDWSDLRVRISRVSSSGQITRIRLFWVRINVPEVTNLNANVIVSGPGNINYRGWPAVIIDDATGYEEGTRRLYDNGEEVVAWSEGITSFPSLGGSSAEVRKLSDRFELYTHSGTYLGSYASATIPTVPEIDLTLVDYINITWSATGSGTASNRRSVILLGLDEIRVRTGSFSQVVEQIDVRHITGFHRIGIRSDLPVRELEHTVTVREVSMDGLFLSAVNINADPANIVVEGLETGRIDVEVPLPANIRVQGITLETEITTEIDAITANIVVDSRQGHFFGIPIEAQTANITLVNPQARIDTSWTVPQGLAANITLDTDEASILTGSGDTAEVITANISLDTDAARIDVDNVENATTANIVIDTDTAHVTQAQNIDALRANIGIYTRDKADIYAQRNPVTEANAADIALSTHQAVIIPGVSTTQLANTANITVDGQEAFGAGTSDVVGINANIDLATHGASIQAGSTITTVEPAIVLATHQANVQTSHNITSQAANIDLQAVQADLSTQVFVTSSPANITLETVQARVDYGATLTTHSANIALATSPALITGTASLTADTANIELNAHPYEVIIDVEFELSTASIAVAGIQAAQSHGSRVSATTQDIELTTHAVAITGEAEATINPAQVWVITHQASIIGTSLAETATANIALRAHEAFVFGNSDQTGETAAISLTTHPVSITGTASIQVDTANIVLTAIEPEVSGSSEQPGLTANITLATEAASLSTSHILSADAKDIRVLTHPVQITGTSFFTVVDAANITLITHQTTLQVSSTVSPAAAQITLTTDTAHIHTEAFTDVSGAVISVETYEATITGDSLLEANTASIQLSTHAVEFVADYNNDVETAKVVVNAISADVHAIKNVDETPTPAMIAIVGHTTTIIQGVGVATTATTANIVLGIATAEFEFNHVAEPYLPNTQTSVKLASYTSHKKVGNLTTNIVTANTDTTLYLEFTEDLTLDPQLLIDLYMPNTSTELTSAGA